MSGTQHIANLFHHQEAAKNGSLVGIEKYDLNHIFLAEFKRCLCDKVPSIACEFLKGLQFTDKEIDNMNLQNILFHINKNLHAICNNINLDKLNEILEANLTSMLDSYFQEISKFDLDSLNDKIPQIETESLKQMESLLTGYSFKSILQINKNIIIIKNILIVLLYYTIKTIEKAQPKIYDLLNYRELIKQRIMATSYGMTTFGGLQTIRDHIFDKSLESGLINTNRTHLNILAEMMSNYFENKFNAEHLNYVTDFLKLAKFLKFRKEKALSFSTKYLTWTYQPRKLKLLRYNIARWHFVNKTKKTMKRRSVSILYKTNDIDRQKISNAFAPLVVQTIEATLMINWLISAQKINDLLLQKLQINYSYSSNYDCFGINYKHAAILKWHLEHSYYETYKMNFYENLINIFESLPSNKKKDVLNILSNLFQLENSPLYWDGIITNNSFVTA